MFESPKSSLSLFESPKIGSSLRVFESKPGLVTSLHCGYSMYNYGTRYCILSYLQCFLTNKDFDIFFCNFKHIREIHSKLFFQTLLLNSNSGAFDLSLHGLDDRWHNFSHSAHSKCTLHAAHTTVPFCHFFPRTK